MSKEKKESTIYKRKCAWCGEAFETIYPNKIYCNSTCAYQCNLKMKRDQWAEAYVPRTYICKECGSTFTTECGNTRSVFCCQLCSDRYKRRKEHACARHKAYMKHQRKCREEQLRKAFVEDVDYNMVFKRDKGVCQICGLPVHPIKNIDSNWDGTIDHVVPLSIGGKHAVSNCQLAHRICNSLKHQQTEKFSINWEKKARESSYWQNKYYNYKILMGYDDLTGGQISGTLMQMNGPLPSRTNSRKFSGE